MEVFRAFGRLVIEGQNAANKAIDAFERRGRAAAKALESLGKAADRVGKTLSKTVTAPILAASTAMGALIVKTAEYGREVSRLSQVSNTNTTTFQRWAAAASSVGIEQEKMADILKDVNDRVGDFMTTGAGPMADFFEKIGPRVGVTIKHFQDLSGPEALQLYVTALERAGVSQQEMTFYMEAMASDSTLLLPLLRNNGAALEALGDKAQAAGRIMSAEAISASVNFQTRLTTLTDTVRGLVSEVGVALIPIAERLADMFETTVLPMIQRGIDNIKELSEWFLSLDEATQEWYVKLTLLAAALGPVLIFIGALLGPLGNLVKIVTIVISYFGGFSVAVLGGILPAILKLIPVIGALWLAWEVAKLLWPMLEGVFDKVVSGGKWLVDQLGQAFLAIPGLIDSVVGWFGGMYDGIIEWFSALPSAVGSFISDMASSVVGKVKDMVSGVLSSLRGLYREVVGNSIIPDMARDVGKEMAWMANQSITEAERLTNGVEKALPREGFENQSYVSGAAGSGRTTYDFRHAVIRDYDDLLTRMRLRGVESTGAY